LAHPYLSAAWARQAIETVRTDPALREAIAGHDVSVLVEVDDAPPGRMQALYASFDGTGGADLRVSEDRASIDRVVEKPTLVITGAYEVFVALRQGQVDPRRALVAGQLKLHGGRLRALAHMRPLMQLVATLHAIPATT
jgi:hypothetical protein